MSGSLDGVPVVAFDFLYVDLVRAVVQFARRIGPRASG
jgi:hypothetical protein